MSQKSGLSTQYLNKAIFKKAAGPYIGQAAFCVKFPEE